MKKEILEWIKSIALALVVALGITYFVTGTRVHGASMNPTLKHEDFLIVINNKNIKHGDIVIVDTNLKITPRDLEGLGPISKFRIGKTKQLIKRVVAIEGDSIEISNEQVFLNGEQLEENYINGSDTKGNIFIEKIPEGKVFVMGDNRGNSLDSRSGEIGLVDIEDIKGKAVLRLYPFSKVGKLK